MSGDSISLATTKSLQASERETIARPSRSRTIPYITRRMQMNSNIGKVYRYFGIVLRLLLLFTFILFPPQRHEAKLYNTLAHPRCMPNSTWISTYNLLTKQKCI